MCPPPPASLLSRRLSVAGSWWGHSIQPRSTKASPLLAMKHYQESARLYSEHHEVSHSSTYTPCTARYSLGGCCALFLSFLILKLGSYTVYLKGMDEDVKGGIWHFLALETPCRRVGTANVGQGEGHPFH